MINNSLHNISRNKLGNNWQVRITRNGIHRSRSFSDGRNMGSPAVSLLRAIETRDEMLSVPFKTFVKNY